MKRTIVASMGFTVDFLIRRLNDLGRTRVNKVILVGLKLPNDPSAWARIEQSYNLLETYLKPLGIGSELKEVVYRESLEPQIMDILAEAFALQEESKHQETKDGESPPSMDCEVELYLSGGPRLLVTAMLVAGFMESLRHPARNMCIASYGEGFDAKYERNLRTLINFLKLDDEHKRILTALSNGITKAEKILETTGMKRSTFYKKLDELRKMGLIVPHKSDRRGHWRLSEEVEKLLISP